MNSMLHLAGRLVTEQFSAADLRTTLDVPTCIQENIISASGEQ